MGLEMSERVSRVIFTNPPDYTVTEATLLGKGFTIEWFTKGAGCGSLGFYFKDGKLMLESQTMDKAFVKDVLSKLVDDAAIAGCD